MVVHVRDPETDAMVRELARKRGVGITGAVKLAVIAQLKREKATTSPPQTSQSSSS